MFWFDVDTVLLYLEIPLELFLPPSPQYDHIHFLCGADHNSLNAGTFLIRVSDYSLHMMAAVLTVESFRPGVDLRFSDQSAIEHNITSQDCVRPFDNFTYADEYARIPQRWFNVLPWPARRERSCQAGKPMIGNSLMEGDMLVHFAGHGETKERRMTKFMNAWERDKLA